MLTAHLCTGRKVRVSSTEPWARLDKFLSLWVSIVAYMRQGQGKHHLKELKKKQH